MNRQLYFKSRYNADNDFIEQKSKIEWEIAELEEKYYNVLKKDEKCIEELSELSKNIKENYKELKRIVNNYIDYKLWLYE